MTRVLSFAAALAGVLLLSGCGVLPQPFAGNPGRAGRVLALPPPGRIAVPAPADALLGDAGAVRWAAALATALQHQDLPAVAEPPRRGDWSLPCQAELTVTKTVAVACTLRDAAARPLGTLRAPPLAAAEWARGSPAVLHAAAAAIAPQVGALLTAAQAARVGATQAGLEARPPTVFFAGVRGASGDGDTSLALQLRRQLAGHGFALQNNRQGARFLLAGSVSTRPVGPGEQEVRIVWTVDDAAGSKLGEVTQANRLPVGTIGPYWGDVALVVVEQALPAIEAILRQAPTTGPSRPAASWTGP